MSGIANGWAYQHGPPARCPRNVLAFLASCADRMGENAYPGVKTIATATGYGRSSVFTALAELEAGGWIEKTTRGGGRGRTTVYRMRMETVQRVDSSERETVQSTNVNGPIYDAHIRKNGRENARQSQPCEVCEGTTWVPVDGSDEFARCVCWLAVAK